jgi:hypothetical protein
MTELFQNSAGLTSQKTDIPLPTYSAYNDQVRIYKLFALFYKIMLFKSKKCNIILLHFLCPTKSISNEMNSLI